MFSAKFGVPTSLLASRGESLVVAIGRGWVAERISILIKQRVDLIARHEVGCECNPGMHDKMVLGVQYAREKKEKNNREAWS